MRMGRVIISCGPSGKGCIFVAQAVRVPSPCHIPAWLCVQAHASALLCWFLLYKGPGLWEAWTSCLFAPAQGRPLPPNAALITFLGYLFPVCSSYSSGGFSDPSLSRKEDLMEKKIMLYLFSALWQLVSHLSMTSFNQDGILMGACS